MRGNSEKRRRKFAPLACAVVLVALLGVLLGLVVLPVVLPLLGIGTGDGAAAVVLVLYGLMLLAVMGGVIAATLERLREIDKGEEEDAKKY